VIIVLTIGSYFVSQAGISKALENARRYYLEEIEDAIKEKNRFAALIDILGPTAGVLFVGAIGLTTAFVWLNV